MNIKFRSMHLVNFMSFLDAELSFDTNGYILITGVNQNPKDSASSNGSGKSSLNEAIIWALTGDTIRGTKNIVNQFADDGCFVELSFDVDNNHFKILRSKNHSKFKTDLKIWINDEDKSGKGIKDSEKLLAEYLPDMTSSLLGSVIILGQGLPQRFTNNTPAGRKEVLEKLSKSDFMIEDIKARISSRKSRVTDDMNAIEATLISLRTKKNLYESDVEDLTGKLTSLSPVNDLESDILLLNQKIQELSKNQTELSQTLADQNETLQQYRDQYVQVNAEQTEKTRELELKYQASRESKLQEKLKTEAEITSVKKEITRIKSIKDVCPTCGQKLPNVIKPDTTEYEAQLENLTQINMEITSVISAIDTELTSGRNEISQLYIAVKNDLTEKANAVKASINNNSIKLSRIQKDLTDQKDLLRTQMLKKDQYETCKAELERSIVEKKKSLDEVNTQLLYKSDEKASIQQRVDILNKFETIVKRDFRGYLLTNVIQYIDNRVKYYSNKIFGNSGVSFFLDGNNISIEYLEKDYEGLSGGEQKKVDLIVQFSIRDMLCKFLNFSSSILILDEVFDALDDIGCQRVIDLISETRDIESIFVITHRKDLSIPYDACLTVTKNSEGISELR